MTPRSTAVRRRQMTTLAAILTCVCAVAAGCSGAPDPSPAKPSPRVADDGPDGAWTPMPSGKALSKMNLKGKPAGATTLHSTLWLTLAAEKALWSPKGAKPVGESPGAITYVGEDLWLVLAGEHALARVNAETGAVTQKADLGANVAAEGLAFDGSSLWVTDRAAGVVLQRDAATGAAIGATPVGADPRFVSAGPTGVWVTSTQDGTVTHISTEPINGKVIDVKKSPKVCAQPHDIAESAHRIWVACYGENVVIAIDPESFAPGPRLELERADSLVPLGDSLLAVGQQGPRVLSIDSTNGQVRRRVELDSTPAPSPPDARAEQPKMSPAMTGNNLYVAVNASDVVYRLGREQLGLPDTPEDAARQP